MNTKPIKIKITVENGKVFSIKSTDKVVVVSYNNDWNIVWLPPVHASEEYRAEIEDNEKLAKELGFTREQVMSLKKRGS